MHRCYSVFVYVAFVPSVLQQGLFFSPAYKLAFFLNVGQKYLSVYTAQTFLLRAEFVLSSESGGEQQDELL